MFLVEYVTSSDPVMHLLRSSAHELFDKPFAGYAVFLFGDADSGVARWFAQSLVPLDSLTGQYIACLVFAKAITVRGTISQFRSPRPSAFGAERDESGAYHLGSISRDYSYRPLVEDSAPTWNPTERDIRVVTYEVDRIASELSITNHLPCVVFFDAIASAEKGLAHIKAVRSAVLPLRDNPGNEVIRFLRRVIHRFSGSGDLGQYVRSLEELAGSENDLRHYQRQSIAPLEKAVEKLIFDHHSNLERLAAVKAELPIVIGGASLKGLRRALSRSPEFSSESLAELETRLKSAKEELAAIAKTISTLQFYLELEPWPLSETSRQRLTIAVDKHVVRWSRDAVSEVVATSRTVCIQVAEALMKHQRNVVEGVLASGPDLDAIIEQVRNRYEIEMGQTQASLAARYGERKVLESRVRELTAYCTSPQRPSLVRAVVSQLREDQDSGETEKRRSGVNPLSVFFIQSTKIGDTYLVEQAGAVGPGASASNMSFNVDLKTSGDDQ